MNQTTLSFFVFILISFFNINSYAQVEFSDISLQDIESVKKLFPDVKSKNTKLSTMDSVIKYLMSLDNYSQIQVSKNESDRILVTAYKLRRVGKLKISGNKAFSTDEVLFSLGIKTGTKFDSGRIVEAGEKLKESYGRKGYFNTIVSFDFLEGEKDELDVSVKIREREPCLVTQVIFESSNLELNQKLEQKVKRYVRKNFAETAILNIEATVQEFLTKNRYINSQLLQREARYNQAKTEVILSYEVTDPYSYQVHISGNQFKSLPVLLQKIEVDNMVKGSVDPGQDITNAIKNYYINNGFSHIKLSFQEKVFPQNSIKKIFVDISEGPRTRLKKIDIIGRISKPASVYSDFLFENSSDQIEDEIYVKSDLDNGYKNLIIHLNNQGYLKAKILSSRIEFSEDRKTAILTVTLDEGPLTQLTKIEFLGLKAFSKDQVLSVLEIKTNSPLRLNEIEASIQKLKQFYYERGYIEMRLLNNNDQLISYDEKGLNAAIQFSISEGPQVFVKSVAVEGNSFTKDYVILREAGIDPGDLVTSELLEETQKRLDKLALFSRVEIRTLEAGTSVSQRSLIISVTERNPGLFKFGAGLTNKREITARGFAGISYSNLGGRARAVGLRGTVENNLRIENYLEYEVGVSYLEPFLFERRLRGRAGYTRSEKITESIDSSNANLSVTDSFKFSLEKDITSRIKFSWLALGFDSIEQFQLPESGPKTRESRQEIGYIGPSLDLDYTDNIFLPTKGHFSKFDLEYAAPEIGSSDKINFMRVQGSFTFYNRISRSKYIWANSIRSGYVKNLSDEPGSGVPSSFAFFLGGYTSVRGYSGTADDRIPNNIEFPTDDDDQLIIEKESTFYLLKSEIRFPLWEDPFGGALFYDAGRVDILGYDPANPSKKEFDHPIRQSIGVGLRINTPVGAISLDYARKLNPLSFQVGAEKRRESPDQWHLSIGTF